jgi:hypothetical protein
MKLNTLNTTTLASLATHSLKAARRLTVGATLLLGCAGMYADDLAIRVTVPFAFTLGSKVMPAGEYTVKEVSGYNGVVTMHHVGEEANAILLARQDVSTSSPSLTFTTAAYNPVCKLGA